MANLAGSAALLFAIGAGVALAQSNPMPADPVSGYTLGKPCRFYLVRHLPAPTRCLVEYLGVWGAGSYIDGEFAFHSRDEWLKWRDRKDYRHWQKHEFDWASTAAASTASAAGIAPAPSAAIPPVAPASVRGAHAAGAVLCPAQISVKLVPGDPMSLSAAGWSLNGAELSAPSSRAPRVEGANLVCPYRIGDREVVVYQSAGSRKCTPRADQTGFDCED